MLLNEIPSIPCLSGMHAAAILSVCSSQLRAVSGRLSGSGWILERKILQPTLHWGAEIDGPNNDGPSKLRDMKLADLTLTDQNAWVEIDGPDIDGRRKQGCTLTDHN